MIFESKIIIINHIRQYGDAPISSKAMNDYFSREIGGTYYD